MSVGGILSGGIGYSGSGVLQALQSVVTAAPLLAVTAVENAIGPWRPYQWALQPPKNSIFIPGTSGTTTTGTKVDSLSGASNNPTGQAGGIFSFTSTVTEKLTDVTTGTPNQLYFFDGVMKVEHKQRSQPTELPVQSGANITDHIFIRPARITWEIFMSDAMQSYTPDQYSGSNSKSVNAYLFLKGLLQNRTLLTINTRLDTYNYVIVQEINVPDNFETTQSLRATVVFQQLFMAQVQSGITSSRAQTTAETAQGQVPTDGVPDTLTDYQVDSVLPSSPYVPDAGTYSSGPLSSDPAVAGSLGQGTGDGYGAIAITGTDVGNPGTPTPILHN